MEPIMEGGATVRKSPSAAATDLGVTAGDQVPTIFPRPINVFQPAARGRARLWRTFHSPGNGPVGLLRPIITIVNACLGYAPTRSRIR